MGEGYEELMRRVLCVSDPPEPGHHTTESAQRMRSAWEVSARWRHECINETCQRTRAKGGKGLQRGELFRCVGWSLGMPRDQEHVHFRDLRKWCGRHQRAALHLFLKWASQCHHVNQAQTLTLAKNFPVYTAGTDFVAESVSPVSNLRFKAVLPPPDSLRQRRPSDLFAVRGDLGAESADVRAFKKWKRIF